MAKRTPSKTNKRRTAVKNETVKQYILYGLAVAGIAFFCWLNHVHEAPKQVQGRPLSTTQHQQRNPAQAVSTQKKTASVPARTTPESGTHAPLTQTQNAGAPAAQQKNTAQNHVQRWTQVPAASEADIAGQQSNQTQNGQPSQTHPHEPTTMELRGIEAALTGKVHQFGVGNTGTAKRGTATFTYHDGRLHLTAVQQVSDKLATLTGRVHLLSGSSFAVEGVLRQTSAKATSDSISKGRITFTADQKLKGWVGDLPSKPVIKF